MILPPYIPSVLAPAPIRRRRRLPGRHWLMAFALLGMATLSCLSLVAP